MMQTQFSLLKTLQNLLVKSKKSLYPNIIKMEQQYPFVLVPTNSGNKSVSLSRNIKNKVREFKISPITQPPKTPC